MEICISESMYIHILESMMIIHTLSILHEQFYVHIE